MLKPDLRTASLHFINSTSEFGYFNYIYEDYRICDDTLVSCWFYDDYDDEPYQCGVYMGLTFNRFHVITQLESYDEGPRRRPNEYHVFSCPASGKFVLLNDRNSVVVLDFF